MRALAVDVNLIKIKVGKDDGARFVVAGLAVVSINDRFIAGNTLSDTIRVGITKTDIGIEDPS